MRVLQLSDSPYASVRVVSGSSGLRPRIFRVCGVRIPLFQTKRTSGCRFPRRTTWRTGARTDHFFNSSVAANQVFPFQTFVRRPKYCFSQLAAARGWQRYPGRAAAGEVGSFDATRQAAIITVVMLVPVLVLLISCVNASNCCLAVQPPGIAKWPSAFRWVHLATARRAPVVDRKSGSFSGRRGCLPFPRGFRAGRCIEPFLRNADADRPACSGLRRRPHSPAPLLLA